MSDYSGKGAPTRTVDGHLEAYVGGRWVHTGFANEAERDADTKRTIAELVESSPIPAMRGVMTKKQWLDRFVGELSPSGGSRWEADRTRARLDSAWEFPHADGYTAGWSDGTSQVRNDLEAVLDELRLREGLDDPEDRGYQRALESVAAYFDMIIGEDESGE